MTTHPPTYTPRQQEVIHLAADRIRVEPNAYNQGEWFTEAKIKGKGGPAAWEESFDNPECGTVACLAGHIALAARLTYADYWYSPSRAAAGEVGFNMDVAHKLFYDPLSWPEPYRRRYIGAREHEAQAKAAADMLDDIADGLVWWDEDADRWVTLEEFCDERDAAKGRDAEAPEPAA